MRVPRGYMGMANHTAWSVDTEEELLAWHAKLEAGVGGYLFVQVSGAIDIRRRDTGLNEAVWFGCLAGGAHRGREP